MDAVAELNEVESGAMMRGMPRDLTVAEVAEMKNVSIKHIAKLCRDGEVEGAYKFGTQWAIPRESAEKLKVNPDLGRRGKSGREEPKT